MSRKAGIVLLSLEPLYPFCLPRMVHGPGPLSLSIIYVVWGTRGIQYLLVPGDRKI